MFPDPKPKSQFEIAIDKLMFALNDIEPDSDEYETVLARISELHKLKLEDQPKRPHPDVIVQSVTSIVAIALIIRHEQFNIITSQALHFVRLR